MPLVRRVPILKGFTPPNRKRYGAVNVGQLSELGLDRIGPDELRAAGIVRKRDKLIKVLGEGEVSKAITVTAHAFSDSAVAKVEAAGGKTEVIDLTPKKKA
jgi:large subunit ribosomal protein L15